MRVLPSHTQVFDQKKQSQSIAYSNLNRKSWMKTPGNKGQDTFTQSLKKQIFYADYNDILQEKQRMSEKTIGLTEAQFEAMLSGELGEVETDGHQYWIVVEGTIYTFYKMDKEEQQEKKGTQGILLDMVQECIDRTKEDLDEQFHKWAMKEDIRYPNQGKNAIRSLEDLIEQDERLEAYDKHKDDEVYKE